MLVVCMELTFWFWPSRAYWSRSRASSLEGEEAPAVRGKSWSPSLEFDLAMVFVAFGCWMA